MRPFKRPWITGRQSELDLKATIDDYSRSLELIPVFRPAPERWFELVVVVDDSISMTVWQETVAEFTQVLRGTGAFRKIHVWYMDYDQDRLALRGPRGQAIVPEQMNSSDGRRLTLVVSDCSSDGWRCGLAWAVIRKWAHTVPIALVNPLPLKLWRRTGLDMPAVRVEPPSVSGARNSALRHEIPLILRTAGGSNEAWIPLPALAMTPYSLGRWARTLMRIDRRGCDAVIVPDQERLDELETLAEGGDLDQAMSRSGGEYTSTENGIIDSFLHVASPEAVRLAILCAPCQQVSLPLLHLIREELVPEATASDEAEVVLSALFTISSDLSRGVTLRFREDTRAELKSMLSAHDVWSLHDALSRRIARPAAGRTGFPAVAQDSHGDLGLPSDAEPFAEASLETLRLLGVVTDDIAAGSAADTGVSMAVKSTEMKQVVPGIRLQDPDLTSQGSPPEPGPDHPDTLATKDEIARMTAERGNRARAGGVMAQRRPLPVGTSKDANNEASRTEERDHRSWSVAGDDRPGAFGFVSGFPVGSRIAGYRLEEQIGQGGIAVVFRAQDERLQRQVALKIFSPVLAADEEFRRHVIRTSRSAAALDDPHAIPVFEAGDADGVLFIAMRYVPSGDVGTLVHRLGPLPVARAAAILSAVASALDAAHVAGLMHGDVKPANVLVDVRPGRPDHVYLSDFGLTRGPLASASFETEADHFLGTPNYCAPEQIRGHQVDARTDEYALACAAYTLLSGEPPFSRAEGLAVLYAHLSEPPPPLTSRRPGLSPAVDDVLLRALAKAPEDRYASCGEFADALRLALGFQRWDSDVAAALHQRSLVDQQHRLGLDHADTLAKLTSPAAASREERGPDEAIALHQQILAHQQRTLGPDHPDTLGTRFAIAGEMAARGDHAAAEQTFRHVLAARQRTLGPDHPDTLATRFAIAREMAARGDHAAAEQTFRHVLAAWQRTLGPDHPDTLATRFAIAREIEARGDHAAAEEHFWHVLAARLRTLGPDHPDTLATRFSIARAMAARGEHAGAEDQFRDVLAGQTRTLGPEHPDTLIVRFNIAREMAARGEHAGAEREFRDLLPHLERRLGPDHPDTLAARFSIAQEMAARRDHAGAEDEFRKVLAARRRTLGPDHPDTLITRFSVAQEMAARGEHAGAEVEFRAVLPHLRRRLGADHPDTLATRFSIAREMAARGDHAGAEDEFREVLPHLERKLGPDHPVTLVLWFSIAQEMAARGDHAGAEDEFRNMLPLLRQKLGPGHPDTLAAAEWIDSMQGEKDDRSSEQDRTGTRQPE